LQTLKEKYTCRTKHYLKQSQVLAEFVVGSFPVSLSADHRHIWGDESAEWSTLAGRWRSSPSPRLVHSIAEDTNCQKQHQTWNYLQVLTSHFLAHIRPSCLLCQVCL